MLPRSTASWAAEPLLFFAEAEAGQAIKTTWQHTWPWPSWLTLLFLAVVGGIAIAAYVYSGTAYHRGVRLTLASLRVALLGLLVFMMYGWMMHRQRTDQPDLIIAMDVSESMAVQDRYRTERLRALAERRVQRAGLTGATRLNLAKSLLVDPERGWLAGVEGRYHVKPFAIGRDAERLITGETSPAADISERAATDSASRLGICLLQILQAQRGRPTAAIILLTDGATTSGATLAEAAEFAGQRKIPLFPVGIGNEAPPRDAAVADLLTDDAVFVDDVLNFDFTVRSSGYDGIDATVQLRHLESGEVLAEQLVKLTADRVPQSVRLTHRPGEPGEITYVVEVLPLTGELNLENNRLLQRIDVRDSTIRVLMAQAYPSYEYRALKDLLSRAVKSERNAELAIELTTILQTADVEHAEQDATARSDFPVTRDELMAYDVVIFGDVDPTFVEPSIMGHLVDFVTVRGGGLILLNGARFTPQAYRDTPLAPLFPFSIESAVAPAPDLPLTAPFGIRPTPLGLETPFLQVGDSSAATERVWDDLDGMYWLLETPDVKPAARVLATHPTRTNDRGDFLPAIVMQFVGAGKVVAHNVDETYFWSRHQVRRQYYDRYWLQLLRYLSRGKLLSDDRPLELGSDRNEYEPGEPVRITLRSAGGYEQLQGEPPALLMIEHEEGERREVALAHDPLRGIHAATVADLKPGSHRIRLISPHVSPPPSTHTIRIVAPQGELRQLQMNAADLRLAARRTRGRYFSIHQPDNLLRYLPRGRQVPIESLPTIPIWNSPALAALFVGLLTAEWLLRKRAGMV